MENKIIVWALFDSENGSFRNAADEFNHIVIYSIGRHSKNKISPDVNDVDLADFSRLFFGMGRDALFKTLDNLPKPDVILASPPCESFSLASTMKGGNACWMWDKNSDDSLTFKVRTKKQYDPAFINKKGFMIERQLLKRINGELCLFNTVEIIKRYQPKVWVIENPAYSRMWAYLKDVLDFHPPFENLTFFGNYGTEFKKPTRFQSNINLELDGENRKAKIKWGYADNRGNGKSRSDIPLPLAGAILNRVSEFLGVSDE